MFYNEKKKKNRKLIFTLVGKLVFLKAVKIGRGDRKEHLKKKVTSIKACVVELWRSKFVIVKFLVLRNQSVKLFLLKIS